MQQLVRTTLLIVCCIAAVAIQADPLTDIYQIDIIVFEHTDPKRFNAEHWPKFVGNLNASKETMDVMDALVAQQQMQLNKEANKIKAGKTSRLIKYIAWQQPLAIGVRATPAYFTAGPQQEVAAMITAKPVRQNLFNVNVDLIYKLQPDEQHLAPEVSEIRVTREVKVKRKEVYYIDHPVIGMLVFITPVILDDTER